MNTYIYIYGYLLTLSTEHCCDLACFSQVPYSSGIDLAEAETGHGRMFERSRGCVVSPSLLLLT